MPPGFDLSKVVDPSQSSAKPSKSGGFDLDKVNDGRNGTGSGSLPGSLSGLDFNNYSFQPKLDVDNNLLRAQNQSWYSQLGKSLGNAVANTATGAVQGLGYLGTIFQGDNSYTNDWVQFFDKPGIHNPFGDIYTEHPDKEFDPGDFGSYAKWLQSTAEGAGALGLMMWGMGEGTLGLANALNDGLKLGTTAAKITRGVAQFGTAALNSYVMGAMSGKQVYEDSYQKQYLKNLASGMAMEDADKAAKSKAGEAAAATVHMTVALNTLLNLGTVASMFKEPSAEIQQFMEGAGKRLEGESRAAWQERIKGMQMSDPEVSKIFNPRHGINSMIAEGAKGGLEMVNMGVATKQGERIGSDKETDDGVGGLVRGYFDHYGEDALTGKGLYDFVFGAALGPAQAFLLDSIPAKFTAYDKDNNVVHKQDADGNLQYKDGKPVYEQHFVSSKAYNGRAARAYFDNVKDAVLDHIDTVNKLNTQLAEATTKGDHLKAEQIRGQLFGTNAIDAVINRATDSWKEEYRQIAKMDNTKDLGEQMQPKIDALGQQIEEARQKGEDTGDLEKQLKSLTDSQKTQAGHTEATIAGYAKDNTDHEYKAKAEEAVINLDHLDGLYKKLHRTYFDNHQPLSKDVVDHLFVRHAQLHLDGQAITHEEARLAEMEGIQNLSSLDGAAGMDAAVSQWNAHVQSAKAVADNLNSDREKLLKAVDNLKSDKPQVKAKAQETIKELTNQYAPKGLSDTAGLQDLADKLSNHIDKHNQDMKDARDKLEQGSGYAAWKEANPGKSFKDYQETIMQHSLWQEDKNDLETAKAVHAIATDNLKDLMKDTGRHELYKQFEQRNRELAKQWEDKVKAENTQDFRKRMEDQNFAKLTLEQKQAEMHKLQQTVLDLTRERNEASAAYNTAKDKLAALRDEKGFFARVNDEIKLKAEMTKAKKRMEALDKKLDLVKEQLRRVADAVDKAGTNVARAEHVVQTAPVDRTDEPPVQEEEPFTEPEQEPESEQPEEEPEDEHADQPHEPGLEEDEDKLPEEYTALVQKLDLNPRQKTELALIEENAWKKLQQADTKEKQDAVLFHLPIMDMQKAKIPHFAEVYTALRQYLKQRLADNKEPTADLQPEPPAPVPPTSEPVEVPKPQPSGQPEMYSGKRNERGMPGEKTRWEDTPKVVQAGTAVASADVEYTEITKPSGEKGLRNKVADTGQVELNQKTSLRRMVPGAIRVGDKVRLEMDTSEKNGFKSYTTSGKIDLHSNAHTNIPIKIIHEATGELIGYLHTQDWLKEKGRNVAEHYKDEKGNSVPGNPERQLKENLEIRQKLARLYNLNPDAAVLHSAVGERTGGQILYAAKYDPATGKTKYIENKVVDAIPQQGLTYATVDSKGRVYTAKGQELTGVKLASDPEKLKGSAVVLLPLPNGEHHMEPIWTEALNPSHIRTVVKAIETYMLAGMKDPSAASTLAKVKEHTGFDISTAKGLEHFIEQYFTHTTGFTKANTSSAAPADVDEEGNTSKVQKFMLHIPKKGAPPQAGIAFGNVYQSARIVDGKLNPEFRQLLESELAKRNRIVNLGGGKIRGINEHTNPNLKNTPFNSVSISEDGKVSSKAFKNYDDYMRHQTSTVVDGTNKVRIENDTNPVLKGKEHYVYSANSQVIIDKESLLKEDLAQKAVELPTENIAEVGVVHEPEVVPVEDIEQITPSIFAGDDDDVISNASKLPTTGILKVDGYPIDLSSVNELMTMVPTDEREPGLTPEDVLEQMRQSGLSAIPEGYNPFRKC